MDALTVHRLHFAFTVTFHYLFPQLTQTGRQAGRRGAARNSNLAPPAGESRISLAVQDNGVGRER